MPGAACLWQPCHVLICIGIGKASSRLGAGCLGPIISLYMCMHSYTVEASGQPAVGCLGQPQYLSIYVQTYTYEMGRNQPAWAACLGRPWHAYMYIMWIKLRQQATGLGQAA